MDKLPITVAVPTKNETANLHACLEKLDRFAEVVVIDSGSTDDTVSIAQSFGARVVDFQWDGRYPKKRNWFLLNDGPTQPWVLFLDADEHINDAFCDAVAAAIKDTSVEGFWLKYTNYFLDRPLRYGVAQRKLALFRVGKTLYEKIDEDYWSKLDMEIHEHPVVSGAIGSIDAPIAHYDFNGIARFLDKHIDYAKWEAHRYAKLQTDAGAGRHFTKRQQFKYRHIARWWYAAFYFFYTYVIKRGMLDGAAGYQYAAYKAWYFQTIRLLIREQTDNNT